MVSLGHLVVILLHLWMAFCYMCRVISFTYLVTLLTLISSQSVCNVFGSRSLCTLWLLLVPWQRVSCVGDRLLHQRSLIPLHPDITSIVSPCWHTLQHPRNWHRWTCRQLCGDRADCGIWKLALFICAGACSFLLMNCVSAFAHLFCWYLLSKFWYRRVPRAGSEVLIRTNSICCRKLWPDCGQLVFARCSCLDFCSSGYL